MIGSIKLPVWSPASSPKLSESKNSLARWTGFTPSNRIEPNSRTGFRQLTSLRTKTKPIGLIDSLFLVGDIEKREFVTRITLFVENLEMCLSDMCMAQWLIYLRLYRAQKYSGDAYTYLISIILSVS